MYFYAQRDDLWIKNKLLLCTGCSGSLLLGLGVGKYCTGCRFSVDPLFGLLFAHRPHLQIFGLEVAIFFPKNTDFMDSVRVHPFF